MKTKLSRSDFIYYFISYTVVTFLVLIVLYPMVYIVSASFSTSMFVLAGKVWLLPVRPTLYNYRMVFQYRSIFTGYRNTLFYASFGSFLSVIITLLCAYPLSRKIFGRGFFTFLFTFTMIFSGGIIPSYIMIRNLRMMNTIWAILIPSSLSVYNMIITRTFFQNSVPIELLEASKLDGCSDAQYFFKVLLPLSSAVIAVIALFYAVGHWNSWFNAFLYISNRNLYPLQLFLRQILIQGQFHADILEDPEAAEMLMGIQEVLKHAIIVISTAPLMCFYPFAQKHFTKGVMIGSLKG